MPLDPKVQQQLDAIAKLGIPPVNEMTPDEARQQMIVASAALGPPEPVHAVEDQHVPSSACDIPIRIYKPRSDAALPVVVYFHGGGWVVGSIDTHDNYCRSLANAADMIVVSVDYRLAPEHTFPAAAEDSYEATRWVDDNIESIGGVPGKLAVAGDSAGGNMAAVTALMSRDRGTPDIAFQVLIYPITDYDVETPSYRDFSTGYFLTRDAMIWFWGQYVPHEADRANPYALPMRAESLQGLPPALIVTAEYDPLRDEGEIYAEKLREAGVEATMTRYDGMIHGFTRRTNMYAKARQALDEVASHLKRVLNHGA